MNRPGGPDATESRAPSVELMPELEGPAAVLYEGFLYVRPAETDEATTRRIEEALRAASDNESRHSS